MERFIRRLLCVAPVLAGACGLSAHSAHGQLRIVDYNIAQNYDIAGDPGGLSVIFAAIGNEVRNGIAKPIDLLAVQESAADGSDAALLAAMLNGIYGVTTYMPAPVPDNWFSGGNGLPGLVYNSASTQLVSTIAFGDSSVQPRSSLRYQFRPTGYDAAADFYLYNNHYKSDDGTTDQNRRNAEAQLVRANADALGEGAHAIYVGDFNVYRSSEPMYQTLLAAGAGKANDPIGVDGNWSAEAYGQTVKHVHTQSPYDGTSPPAFPGQVAGGLDSRFDFQLLTDEFFDDEGLSYIGPTAAEPTLSHSYRVFGNDGTHDYKGAITTGSGAAPNVLEALRTSSDHLPVVADYRIPAKMQVQVAAIPTSVAVGAAVSIDVLINNIASALTSLGADELDYTLSVAGDLLGGAAGTIAALSAGDARSITLNTATPGLKSGLITVTASSQGAAGALFTAPVNYFVGDGAPVRAVIARDDFDAPLKMTSFDFTPAIGVLPGTNRGFQVYQVGVSSTIPNALKDDSAGTTPNDSTGVIRTSGPGAKMDAWFGVVDTVDPANPSGQGVATWIFDVAGASALEISIDMAAMGDFEAAGGDPDVYNWTYSMDGGAFQALFTSSVHEDEAAQYTLAGGAVKELDDPLYMSGAAGGPVRLSNVLQTLTAAIPDVGQSLTLRLTARTNSTEEAFAFDNIVVTGLVAAYADADFNQDGSVDGDDLAAWQAGYGNGETRAEGDADLDGGVDGADFLTWQRQITAASGTAATGNVPEPATATLALLIAAALWRRK